MDELTSDGITTLNLVTVEEIKSVVDVLADLGIDPLHLHIDGQKPLDARPEISMWARYRTDFARICAAFGVKGREQLAHQPGQRHWYAEHDTTGHRLLIQCVSMPHHHDWQPKERGDAR